MLRRILLALMLIAGAAAGLTIAASSSSATPAFTCNGTYNSTTFDSVIVQSGQSCFINNSLVKGSVTVKKNSAFETCNDVIKGSVVATSSYVAIDNGTEVDGSITLTKPGSPLAAGRKCESKEIKPNTVGYYSSYICPWHIGGNLTIQSGKNHSQDVEVGDCGWMDILGSFNIENNRLFVEAGYFEVHGSLVCVNNNPAPEIFTPFQVDGTTVGCGSSGGTTTITFTVTDPG